MTSEFSRVVLQTLRVRLQDDGNDGDERTKKEVRRFLVRVSKED